MKLLISPKHLRDLRRWLIDAGNVEIGGVMAGEQLAPNKFRLREISLQVGGGTYSTFVRDPEHCRDFMEDFFLRQRDDYLRFNYLGEWHSHPNVSVAPSGTDEVQMMKIVEEGADAPSFATLMIVQLSGRSSIKSSCSVYQPGSFAREVSMCVEIPDAQTNGPLWWQRLLNLDRRVDVIQVQEGRDANETDL